MSEITDGLVIISTGRVGTESTDTPRGHSDLSKYRNGTMGCANDQRREINDARLNYRITVLRLSLPEVYHYGVVG